METQPTTVTTITQPDGRTLPPWIVEKIATGDVFQDRKGVGLLRVKVCRNCQCALEHCLCSGAAIDDVPIWRFGQGLNTRLAIYLKTKKELHTTERTVKTTGGSAFVPNTAEDMRKRMALWAGMSKLSNHPAAEYMRKLFVKSDRVLVQLIHATETWKDKKGTPEGWFPNQRRRGV